MPSKILLSIVVPAYNAERFIASAIESCLAQSAREAWELIVIDDGSTDGTRQCVERYLSDPRVKLLTQANRGVSAARNFGIRRSAGKFIALLDADDYYRPGTLHAFLQMCRQNKGKWGLLYCDYERVNEYGESIAHVRCRPPLPRPHLYAQLLLPKALPILPSNVVVSKAAIEEVGDFDERFVMLEGVELWSRIVHRFSVVKLNIASTYRRVHDEQATVKRRQMIHWRETFNLTFLKRHDFSYFCGTSDPIEQSRVAERLADLLLSTDEPIVRTATFLYETALRLDARESIRNKLEQVKALAAKSDADIVAVVGADAPCDAVLHGSHECTS